MKRPRPTPTPLAPLLLSTLALSSLTPVYTHEPSTLAHNRSLWGSSLSSLQTTSNISYSSTVATLLSQSLSSSDAPQPIVQTTVGGHINAVCLYGASSDNKGTLYVGGQFSELGGVQVDNIARIDLSSGNAVVSALNASGVEGVVDSLFCDDEGETVWIGGNLTGPVHSSTANSSSYGGRVVQYLPSSDTFSPPPFVGFSSGSVISITNTSASSLLFTGSFQISYSTSNSSNSSSSSDSTGFSPTGLPLSNITVYSPGSTPFSASLTPVPVLGPNTQIDASPSTNLTAYSDPDVLFCPTGADGEGHSWLAGDDQVARINVALGSGRVVTASGLRIGNTFVDGRGTSSFRMVTIPNDVVQALSYLNTSTNSIQTCSDACPLSLNSSIPFQDFTFSSGAVELTGFQLLLLEWTGSGSGLHLVELLSAGSYATPSSANTTSCASIPSTTNSSLVGDWTSIDVDFSAIGGTTTQVLTASVPVSSFTSNSTSPSVTYYPYLTGTGNYTVDLLIPGCQDVGDCLTRTSLDITFTPYQNAGSFAQTIPPNQSDQAFTIYTGAIQASSDSFNPAVKLSMSSTPTGVNGDDYTVVAGTLVFNLSTIDTTGNGSGTVHYANANGLGGPGNVTSSSSQATNSSSRSVGFGVFEYPRGTAKGTLDAASVISNDSETSFDRLGVVLASSLGSFSPSTTVSSAVLVGETYFIGGSFSTANYSNIVSFSAASNQSSLVSLAEGGLNGSVNALLAIGTDLFVGGSFTGTVSGRTTSFTNLAKYDTKAEKWEVMQDGVDGTVTRLSVTLDGKTLLIGGEFGTLLSTSSSSSNKTKRDEIVRRATDGGTTVGGFGLWDVGTEDWANSQPGVQGNVGAFGVGQGDQIFFGGAVTGVTSSQGGSSGSSNHHRHLSQGVVVVICMALALGVVFLGVLLGVIVGLWKRHREDQQFYPTVSEKYADDASFVPFDAQLSGWAGDGRGRSAMLDHINAATEGVILGSAGGGVAFVEHERRRAEREPITGGTTEDYTQPGTDETVYEPFPLGVPLGESEEGDMVEARVVHARWSLIPDMGAERELRLSAGKPYLILNDSDPEWWLALDPTTGEQGAVPATWML